MTDHEMLELLVREFSGMKTEIKEIKTDLQEVKSDVKLMKSQLSEHSGMIQSLIHASETQKAQHDALQMEVAKLSGEMQQGFTDLTEMQKSLMEMYGEHEAKIRMIQRRPV